MAGEKKLDAIIYDDSVFVNEDTLKAFVKSPQFVAALVFGSPEQIVQLLEDAMDRLGIAAWKSYREQE